ncbi:MAG TPA: DNA-3-methyladenine glycosylase, partial [Candidatus Binataceae bacterium]
GAAANAIYGRFVASFPGRRFPTPEQVAAAPDELLRKAGLSARKALYIKDLAAHVRGKAISFHRFPKMEDEEIVSHLTRVKGIGRWTAEIFLMFNLGRPDVLPMDDLGVRNAIMKVYGLRKPPDRKQMIALGERWRPYRSVAAWYLWQSHNIILPDGDAKKTSRAKKKAH